MTLLRSCRCSPTTSTSSASGCTSPNAQTQRPCTHTPSPWCRFMSSSRETATAWPRRMEPSRSRSSSVRTISRPGSLGWNSRSRLTRYAACDVEVGEDRLTPGQPLRHLADSRLADTRGLIRLWLTRFCWLLHQAALRQEYLAGALLYMTTPCQGCRRTASEAT